MAAAGVARFKWPERLEIRAELPVTKVGKLDKKAMRDWLGEQHIMTDIETHPATGFDSAEHQARLKELYRDFEAAGMTPLWLTREGLMPFHPQPRAVPHLWRWAGSAAAGRAQRRARPGGPRRRAPRDQPRQPGADR